MDDLIQLLPDHVANQIAAGEVVQRPASVVKELLENAIDAGASKIHMVIKDAGRTLIQVIDDGQGMSVTDARMAFERHATSKIKTTEDIFAIRTKGFRGEALASIAAIAQVELKTKRDEDEVGTLIQNFGGKIENQQPEICAKGTTISVKNLFYNVPARRNFLKSNNVEFRHILDEFHRVALAHENVEFSLIHNDNEVLRLSNTNLAQRILHIFGRKLEGKLVPISEETDLVKISGFVGKPEIAKKSRGEQFFFVNNRFIRSGYLHKALQSAFENLIKPGFHPSYFLFLELPPDKIDINIHPTKTEIKFEDDFAIYAVLRTAVKHALGQHQVMPTLDFDVPEWQIPVTKKDKPIRIPEVKVDRSYNPFEVNPPGDASFSRLETHRVPKETYTFEVESELQETPLIEKEMNGFSQVTRWGNRYLVALMELNLFIIDQNRAHQKILFEHFMQKNEGSALSQQLLFPIEMNISPQEELFLKETETYLIQFGFALDWDKEQLIITAVPADLTSEMATMVITDFLSAQKYPDEIDYAEYLAKFMAKSAAVKKGTEITDDEARHLAQQLFSLGMPVYSPFGKKIYKKVTQQELIQYLQ